MVTVRAMPASEFLEWQAYFSIYGFTFERQDVRHAELLAAVLNDGRATRAQAAGKRSVELIKVSELLPDYLGREITVRDPKQRAEYQRFKARLAEVNERHNQQP